MKIIEAITKIAEKLGKVKGDIESLDYDADSLERTYLEGYQDALEISIKVLKEEIAKAFDAR
jgi:hypothetical protein